MKIQLLILFVAACVGEEDYEEEYENMGDYPLFHVKFQDIILVDPLLIDLLLKKEAAMSCYSTFHETFENYAKKYQNDIMLTQEFYMALEVKYRPHAMNILKTFKKLARDLIECQVKIWEKLKKNQDEAGFNKIIDCRKQISDHYDKYEEELKFIIDRKNKHRLVTKMKRLNDELEIKFNRTTEDYVSCVEKLTQN